jgi:hypothetical protein
MVTIPVSVGELIDKLSILHVKKIKIVNESKLSFINNEFELIYNMSSIYFDNEEILTNLNKEIEKRFSDFYPMNSKVINIKRGSYK